MLIIEGPGIGPEDFDRISQEMREWKASQVNVVEEQVNVVEEATRIVLEHQAELARHGLLPEPRPRP
jgi:hypothetical protein